MTPATSNEMQAARQLSPITIEDSLEALLSRHGTASRWVYNTIVVLATLALAATAIVTTDITLRAPGVLAPTVSRQQLRSAVNGSIEAVRVANGSVVHPGDTIAVLAPNAADHSLTRANSSNTELRERERDLRSLLALRMEGSRDPVFISPEGAAAARAARVEWRQHTTRVTHATLERTRTATLAARGFASPSELTAAELELAGATEDRMLALERRRAEWAQMLAATRQELTSLEREIATSTTDQALRYIIAPTSGTIEDLAPITPGTVVRAGEPIATISPTSTLQVEALVAQKDVAFIHTGMAARILVEGFNTSDWGAANATVSSVASDFTVVDGRPAFRVLLKLSSSELRRPNGHRAKLGKGLRAQVRFIAGEQRLVDLLRHRASDWLDPATS